MAFPAKLQQKRDFMKLYNQGQRGQILYTQILILKQEHIYATDLNVCTKMKTCLLYTSLFVAFEPLACKRVVKLTDTRTAVDFAHFLRELIEVHYSHCEKILLVMDNLNIHAISSLYKVFDPATARHIARRLDCLLYTSRCV